MEIVPYVTKTGWRDESNRAIFLNVSFKVIGFFFYLENMYLFPFHHVAHEKIHSDMFMIWSSNDLKIWT